MYKLYEYRVISCCGQYIVCKLWKLRSDTGGYEHKVFKLVKEILLEITKINAKSLTDNYLRHCNCLVCFYTCLCR